VHARWIVFTLAIAGCRPAPPAGTVFYASGADLQSINPLLTTHPLARQVQRYLLFTTLVRYDSALAMQPYLASAWEWSADRTSLTLHLRDDIRWHDGQPTTAGDVAFTIAAARDPATGYPRAAELACVTPETGDRSPETVVLRFCRPQPGIPDVLADLAILPQHLLRDVPHGRMRTAAFNEHPVGNGPFRFVEHLPNRRWLFAANAGWPAALGGPPPVHRFALVIVDEATTKLAGLVDGELDFAGINPMHAAIVRKLPQRAVVEYPLLFTYGLIWNTRRAPFDDVRMRRALTMALDRQQMLDAYVYGFGELADGPVPASHPLAVTVPRIPFDRAGARALLDSLGWTMGEGGVRRRQGRTLDFAISTVGSSDNVLEQLIQADLAAVGVRVRIRQLELGAFLAAAQGTQRDYDALVTGITGDLALGWLGALFDSRRLAEPLQYAQYRNPDVDRALDRRDMAEVQRLVARDVPITFLYHARGVQGVNLRVTGVTMDLRGELATVSQWRVR
jgi:peptide/nickel transport system substrate-binding protein